MKPVVDSFAAFTQFTHREVVVRSADVELHSFAELERSQIAERTSNAMRHYQANGRLMTRRDQCPYGRQADPADPERMVEDAREQAAIAKIREHRELGKGYRAIANALDQAGIDCRGRRWCHTTIRSVLRRSAHAAVVAAKA